MIKQVVTHQLQTLESSTEQPRWVLELPFKTPAGLMALEAEIEREHPHGQPEDACWSIRLRLDLPRLGPLLVNLTLRQGRLNATLYAGAQEAARVLDRHLDELRRQLEAREIEVASLHAGHRQTESARPRLDTPLVSEQA